MSYLLTSIKFAFLRAPDLGTVPPPAVAAEALVHLNDLNLIVINDWFCAAGTAHLIFTLLHAQIRNDCDNT